VPAVTAAPAKALFLKKERRFNFSFLGDVISLLVLEFEFGGV